MVNICTYCITVLLLSALSLNILDIPNPLTDFVTEYYVDPILDESGGDGGTMRLTQSPTQ